MQRGDMLSILQGGVGQASDAHSVYSGNTIVLVSPPQTKDGPLPLSLASGAHCLVIDKSGSMGCAAVITTEDGDKVDNGWSLLDIAKHSACTYAECLTARDCLRVVSYSSTAEVVLEWTICDAEGKKRAKEAILALRPADATNFASALQTGFESFADLRSLPLDVAPHHLVLSCTILTDGQPTLQYAPPQGYRALVDECRARLSAGAVPCAPAVTLIGLGNSVNSLLLSMLGTFLHMPDAGCVGPFIVNLIAANRTTAAVRFSPDDFFVLNNACLTLCPKEHIRHVFAGCLSVEENDTTYTVGMRSIQFDQPRSVVVDASGPITASLSVPGAVLDICCETTNVPPAEATPLVPTPPSSVLATWKAETLLGTLVELLLETSRTLRCDELLRFAHKLEEGSLLRVTVESQVPLALAHRAYQTWGQHYLRTLPLMIQLRRRSNFRDACLADFGKDASGREGSFHAVADEAEMAFACLPPPPPSLLTRRACDAERGTAPVRLLPAEFMRGGGCFSGDSTVSVLAHPSVRNGEEAVREDVQSAHPERGARGSPVGSHAWCVVKAVRDVRKGDFVETTAGFVEVECVVLSHTTGGRDMVQVGPDARLSLWHPILLNTRWSFPATIVDTEFPDGFVSRCVSHRDPCVWNFVLKERAGIAIFIGNIPCAVLGHGIEDEDVVSHEFWGGEGVIRWLRADPAYSSGIVFRRA